MGGRRPVVLTTLITLTLAGLGAVGISTPASAASVHLSVGSHSDQVHRLEVGLNRLGYLSSTATNWTFGQSTLTAVHAMQKVNGWKQTDAVGDLTYRRATSTKTKPKPKPTPPDPLVMGHRGTRTSAAPENTLTAFAYAARHADIIEMDVQSTADAKLVIIHDETLDRTTDCTGRVDAHTLAQIERCDAGSWLSERFAGTRVPTLDQMLRATRGRRIAPEIKAGATPAEIASFVSSVKRYGDPGRTIVQSFDPAVLKRVATLDPSLSLALVSAKDVSLDALRGFDHFFPAFGAVTSSRVQAITRAGHRVVPYTARTAADFATVVRLRPYAICTDDPAGLRAYLARH